MHFSPRRLTRRSLLRYAAGSTMAAIALGYLRPGRGQSVDLEKLCTLFPLNSRCEDYAAGVAAIGASGQPLNPEDLKTTAKIGDRVLAQGLAKPVYLVITEPGAIAPYAISTVCTHFGCIVNWQAETRKFICPCHESQFDDLGRVVRGPAPRNLGLTTVILKPDQVRLAEVAPAIDPR